MVIMGHVPIRLNSRIGLVSSLGIRYVPKPSVRDLTPVTSVPAYYFGLGNSRQVDKEAGAAITLKIARRVLLYAEERLLLRGGTEWNPKRRSNFGVAWQF
jgi:hypothetical protein